MSDTVTAPALSGALAALAAFYINSAETELAAATAADDVRWMNSAERRVEHWRAIVATGGAVLGVRQHDFSAIAAEHKRIDPAADSSGCNAPWWDESGHWAVYGVALSRGGSEEGGWWFEAGELIASVRASRRVVRLRGEPATYCDRIDGVPMVPDSVLAMILAMEAGEDPRDGFAGDVSRMYGQALRLHWVKGDDAPPAYFPASRPAYE